MILVQVEVQRTWVVAKGAVNQLSGNRRSGILFLFFYVFFSLLSIGFSGFEGIDQNVDFKEVFYVGQFFPFYTTELLLVA